MKENQGIIEVWSYKQNNSTKSRPGLPGLPSGTGKEVQMRSYTSVSVTKFGQEKEEKIKTKRETIGENKLSSNRDQENMSSFFCFHVISL